jgi:hypothetical protein
LFPAAVGLGYYAGILTDPQLQSFMGKETFQIPTDRCDECGQTKAALGFVSLSSDESGPARHVCSACFNRWYMQRAGLPELETVDFEPMTRCDSVGKQHTFHFVVHMSTGLGIKAFEWVGDGPGGYQFFVLEPPEMPVREAYAKLVKKIEAGLAVRYLRSSDFPGSGASQNRLYLNGTAVNGRIDEREGTPTVVVDGREYTWEEFGEFLSSFNGFNFRLECFDACESVETTPDPERPNPVWWLPEPEPIESDDQRHH